jgi:hypothetical protein
MTTSIDARTLDELRADGAELSACGYCDNDLIREKIGRAVMRLEMSRAVEAEAFLIYLTGVRDCLE